MLLVDYREGSKELIAPLLKMGLPVQEADIDADLAFTGRGEGGVPVDVGIEFKQLRECVASMRTERLQGLQLPRMCKVYEFRYLLLEGELKFNKRGTMLRRTGKRDFKPMPGAMSVGEFLKRLHSMHLCAGLNWSLMETRAQTLKYIETLYRSWTDQDLDKHKSHLGVYNPPTPVPVSEFRQAVMKWPGIGYKASLAVEQKWGGSIRRASGGTLEEWAALTTADDAGKTRRLGESTAQRIVNFLEGR